MRRCAATIPFSRLKPPVLTPVELRIGEYIANLVEDGATLQNGIGGIPDAALRALKGHRDLGMHTEMFSDGAMELMRCGALTGKRSSSRPASWSRLRGLARAVRFLDDNPMIEMRDISYVNDTSIIRTNEGHGNQQRPEVDITGQVCADSWAAPSTPGGRPGGFHSRSRPVGGGKPIIALNSLTSHGESKIVARLKPGASVTTSRAHVITWSPNTALPTCTARTCANAPRH